ncbi:MAG: sugar phosphate isomerase/epimerase [Clostridia bacterium]|nr:sugar phosphate isomerase/epimerase [Clostridia bacterium]
MKIGVSSYSFSKYIVENKCDYFKICDIAKEMGFDGIEFIDLDNGRWGITTDPIACAKEVREYCKKIGLDIIAYTVGANLVGECAEASVDKLLFDIEVARELGAPLLRHDVCSKLPEGYTYRNAIDEMVPRIRRVTEAAKKYGIRTSTENHGHIFQAPERVEELIKAVDNENYGWLCDMGNFLCVDCDPLNSVKIAAPYAFHVHAKDFLYKSKDGERPMGFFGTAGGNHLRGTAVGHGVVPVKECVDVLVASGYDGYISLEFEGLEDAIFAISAGLDFIKKCI